MVSFSGHILNYTVLGGGLEQQAPMRRELYPSSPTHLAAFADERALFKG
jgi:hypothetical protein